MIDVVELKARNAPLNAFVDFADDVARGSDESPLVGLTIGVKANIMAAGLPWTGGLAAYRNRIAERDAEVVARLRAAGASIIGMLNMEEGALGAKTDNPVYGATQNPHRQGYSPGGSSGGSGAAVAAGLCDIALGTDTMGSVRIPAAHCGVYGFKPANDRVSQDGLEPADLSLDAIGPLARSLDMLERATRTISDFGDGSKEDKGAVLMDHGVKIEPDVARAFARACEVLAHAPNAVRLAQPLSRIRYAGFRQVSQTMAAHLRGVEGQSDRLKSLLGYGPNRTPDQVQSDGAILQETRNAVQSIVAKHGWLMMPTVPNPPFPHGASEPAAQADFTCLANIGGLPAISLPMGWTEDGLPLGVQLVGRPGYEAGLFSMAYQLDTKLGAYRAPA